MVTAIYDYIYYYRLDFKSDLYNAFLLATSMLVF